MKDVKVIVNVNKNERNVELTNEPLKKSKTDRSKLRSKQSSPTRLSVKERLGEKIEDIKSLLGERRESVKSDSKNHSPRHAKDRRISIGDDSPIVPNPERKVFVGDRKKRDKSRIDSSRHAEVSCLMVAFFLSIFFLFTRVMFEKISVV